MKKKVKKLVLAKETLRTLEPLADVRGGTAGCFTTGCDTRAWNCFCPNPPKSNFD